jgi:hypothetical protein
VNALQSQEEQAQWWSLAFRYAFYLRNIRGQGKRERQLFYFLFQRLYSEFPQSCCQLVSLIPEFGCFKDLQKLIVDASSLPTSGKDLVASTIACLYKQLDADTQLVFGKPLAEIQAADADAMNTRLKAMSRAELSEFTKDMKLSLAAKWFTREARAKNMEALESDPRELFVRTVFVTGKGEVTPARLSYAHMRLRKIVTALSQCSRVAEQLMCVQPAKGIKRNWADIDISTLPAGAANKYRKALLNEKLESSGMRGAAMRTGDRFPDRADRVLCRQHTLRSVTDGKLKGANLDLAKLSSLIWREISRGGDMGSEERALVALQWQDMVNSVKKDIEQHLEALGGEQAGRVDPRNIIPIVDTSGSMGAANVQDVAIGLGLMATALSTAPGAMISFSERPEAFMIDLQQDIFEQFRTVQRGPMGLSTNVDATYRLVLDMMVANKVPAADFALLILTDGQFDSQVSFDGERYVDSQEHFQSSFLERMEKAFQEKGFEVPRTIFWNLNSRVPGFPAEVHTRGVQMVSGFSQGVMRQVFTADFPEPAPQEAPVAEDPVAEVPATTEAKTEAPAVETPAVEPVVEAVVEVVPVEAEVDTTEAAKVEEPVVECDLDLSSESELDSPPAAAVAPSRSVVTPWKSFVRVLTSDTFEPVLRSVLQTGEGVFATASRLLDETATAKA